MSLLKPAENQTAYLKAGILGFQGSGKTFTATHIAAGLAKMSDNKNPKVAFFDTEKGSDFFVPFFKEQGIQFDTAKTRSFQDLLGFMREVEKESYDVAIIDSISHVWRELTDSYQRRLNRRNGLLFQDWGVVKREWQQFTDAFINSKIHTIVLGRAGYEYDMSEDESGKKELLKTGTKMKAEGEFGYESDLLLEMERVRKEDGKGWYHHCYVLKDRTDTINDQEFNNPTFDTFKPVLRFLNIGGTHMGVDTSRNSEDMFEDPDYSASERYKQKQIALENMQNLFIEFGYDGSSTDAKKKRVAIFQSVFGTASKTEIENLSLEKLREGIQKIKHHFEVKSEETANESVPA